MLETLANRIAVSIPHAVNRAIPVADLTLFHLRRMFGGQDHPSIAYERSLYEAARINLTYNEIAALDDQDFFMFQSAFQGTVIEGLTAAGIEITDWMSTILLPNGKKNILTHERDHLKPVSQPFKERAWFEFYFYKDKRSKIGLNGQVHYDALNAGDYENALAASEPQSLSLNDIHTSRRYSDRTSDYEFIHLVEERIAARERH